MADPIDMVMDPKTGVYHPKKETLMTRKQVGIGGAIVALLIIVGGLFVWSRWGTTPSAQQQAQMPAQQTTDPNAQAIADLKTQFANLLVENEKLRKKVESAATQTSSASAPADERDSAPPNTQNGEPRVYSPEEVAEFAARTKRLVGIGNKGFYVADSTDKAPPGRTGCTVVNSARDEGGTAQVWKCPRKR